MKKLIAVMLAVVISFASIDFGFVLRAEAATQTITLYFVDKTSEKWVGNDVVIKNAKEAIYQPKAADWEVEEHIYAYVVTHADEGATELRLWRGNEAVLSFELEEELFKDGFVPAIYYCDEEK